METIKSSKILTGIIFVLFIITAFMLLAYVFGLFREISSPISPPSTPISEPTSSAKRIPSSLAIEPTFIELEKNLQSLEQDLTTVDLSEPKLSLPILEKNIDFEKQ